MDGLPTNRDAVVLALDELEALRLADLDGLYQSQAAERMDVSRATFGRILDAARKKVANALVHGTVLRIAGGTVVTDADPMSASEDAHLGVCTCRHRHDAPAACFSDDDTHLGTSTHHRCPDAPSGCDLPEPAFPHRRIFVYGTLLRGGTNHGLLRDAKFLGRARTRPEFTLYDLGAYPAMVAGGTTIVHGEIYEVGPETLRALDELEEHPTYYRRTAVELADDTKVETYLLPPEFVTRSVPIERGRWPVRVRCPRASKDSASSEAETLQS